MDKASFLRAENDLTRLSEADLIRTRPCILVGNKVDLARSKAVSSQGKLFFIRLLRNNIEERILS